MLKEKNKIQKEKEKNKIGTEKEKNKIGTEKEKQDWDGKRKTRLGRKKKIKIEERRWR